MLSALGLPVLAIVAICDLLFRRVPNWLPITGLVVHALGLAGGGSPGLTGFSMAWSTSLIGLLCALLIFVPLWKFGAMGAGDVKFMGLLGFLFGLPGLSVAWLVGSVLAGLHVMAVMFARHSPGLALLGARWRTSAVGAVEGVAGGKPRKAACLRFEQWRAARMGSRQGAPYATYLAIGAGLWLAWSNGLLG